MAEWYVKELSKLTQVSVQTLHHYDRIGLLAPSVRLANGYRLYSEKDLLKLQQIIALKFFGFELSQIKTLLSSEVNMVDHLSVQSQLLEEKASALLEASQTLKGIISDCGQDKSLHWETIIKVIGVYRMTQQLEKTWAGKALNKEELKQLANLYQELPKKFSEKQEKQFEKAWLDIVSDVNANLENNPESEIGIGLGKRCLDWANDLYGKEYIVLRSAMWEKGFLAGHAGAENNLSQEGVVWLDHAMSAYCRSRIYQVLNKIEALSEKQLLTQWEALLSDICGDEKTLKNEIFAKVMDDDHICPAAKNWLLTYITSNK